MLKFGLVIMAATTLGTTAHAQQLAWKEMAELPRPVAGYMAGVQKGKLLVIGGSYWENKQKHWTSLVQIFDPLSGQWEKGSPLPAPRSDAASVTLGEDIYCFGGGSGTEVRRDALVLHEGKWRALPEAELPEPRLYAVAISSGSSIYVLGGMAKAGDYAGVTNTFWRWHRKAKTWEVLPPLPGPGRISHAMAEIAGEIYVFGGATAGGADVVNLRDAYKFDPSAKKWTRLPDLTVANRSWWAVGLGQGALVLAGYTDTYASEVYLYHPEHNLQPAGPLPHGVADAKFFRIGNIVVGSGGESGPGVRGKWTFQAEIPKSWQGERE